MDKLCANDFGSEQQLSMFYSLMKIVENQVVLNKHVGKSKSYINGLTATTTTMMSLKCLDILTNIVEAKKCKSSQLRL